MRVLLAQQESDRALDLRMLRSRASIQRRTNSVIELQALEARNVSERRRGRRAGDPAGALGLALPEGYVRVFVDEGTPMARLVGKLASARRSGRIALRGRLWSMTSSGCSGRSVLEVPRDVAPIERTG